VTRGAGIHVPMHHQAGFAFSDHTGLDGKAVHWLQSRRGAVWWGSVIAAMRYSLLVKAGKRDEMMIYPLDRIAQRRERRHGHGRLAAAGPLALLLRGQRVYIGHTATRERSVSHCAPFTGSFKIHSNAFGRMRHQDA
jgi:hypothetical protein